MRIACIVPRERLKLRTLCYAAQLSCTMISSQFTEVQTTKPYEEDHAYNVLPSNHYKNRFNQYRCLSGSFGAAGRQRNDPQLILADADHINALKDWHSEELYPGSNAPYVASGDWHIWMSLLYDRRRHTVPTVTSLTSIRTSVHSACHCSQLICVSQNF